ncbi:MAG TPA: DNA polymerase III subunit beta [Fibrobacteraceae bacterium]|nr:DNA polymerase III subunit beta [Fibrobacteraceae bacterium]
MQFEAQKPVILEALQAAFPAVPNKSTLQILNNFLLRLEGDFLEVSATDLDLGIRVRTGVTGHRDGSVVVNARKLLDLIKVLPDTLISLDVEDYLLRVTWGQKGKASITGVDGSDFPPFPELGEEGQTFSISRAELAFLADKTSFAVSTDSTRLTLNGVYAECSDSKLLFVATDGHRLGKAFVEQESPALQKGIIIPPKALSHVLRAVSDDSAIEIRVDEAHILFTGERIQVVSKLIEGPYPKYESVIPVQFERTVQANRMEFAEVVRHVSAFANQRTRQIRMALDGANVEVSASDPNSGGECRESFLVTHEGDGAFAIGFNGQYLADILGMCPSEEVRLKMNSPVGACIIEPVGEGLDFFFLLMPLRLADDT